MSKATKGNTAKKTAVEASGGEKVAVTTTSSTTVVTTTSTETVAQTVKSNSEPKTVSFIKLKAETSEDSSGLVTLKTEPEVKDEEKSSSPQPQQQIYIIQTTDGNIPMDGTEVIVTDDNMAVYETVSALEQLSRGQVITTTTAEDGSELMVYEEVVLPDESSGIVDQFVDVQEVEVGDGRSASPVKIETVTGHSGSSSKKERSGSPFFIPLVTTHSSSTTNTGRGGGNSNSTLSLSDITDLHCSDCGKLFKSKRSLFGHKKEKHSGVTEVHHCPECGKSFGRKSNLKAHRESLHYGKKFPCAFCDRIFTNRSSMNQHIKKTHVVTTTTTDDGNGEETVVQQFVIQQE